jgi:DTW domain-containing protein YfiP
MRSVVLKPTVRCPVCELPPRWCICAAQRDLACPLQIDLLLHEREVARPSSTGKLIKRLFPAARQHIWSWNQPLAAETVINPERELWILHPHGHPAPSDVDPGNIQVALLDGLWNETATMSRAVSSWGRLVSLPMRGESRYWLRAQQDSGRFSTVEALLFLLDSLQLTKTSAELRTQFELHVYATLRARGRIDLAAAFLADSMLPQTIPDYLASLQQRRPL